MALIAPCVADKYIINSSPNGARDEYHRAATPTPSKQGSRVRAVVWVVPRGGPIAVKTRSYGALALPEACLEICLEAWSLCFFACEVRWVKFPFFVILDFGSVPSVGSHGWRQSVDTKVGRSLIRQYHVGLEARIDVGFPMASKEIFHHGPGYKYYSWVKMDDPNITMEEYIRLEKEKARRRGKVYNWETATYGKIWDNEDVHDLGSVETEFPAIVLNDALTYEIRSPVNPRCLNDLDFLKDFENEFPAIVYNDALTSKSDFSTEPTLSPQHIDEFDLKDETSLSECDEEEQNVLYFNDVFLVLYKVEDIATCLVEYVKFWDDWEVDRYGNANLDYYSEDQYAISIKEDTAYPCLHSPMTTEDEDQYAVLRENQYTVFKIWNQYNILEDIKRVDTTLIHLESRKSPTADLFDDDSGRISIHHCEY
ncbi:hypothetical protein Tco_0643744 [Tanacetum coccineum]